MITEIRKIDQHVIRLNKTNTKFKFYNLKPKQYSKICKVFKKHNYDVTLHQFYKDVNNNIVDIITIEAI